MLRSASSLLALTVLCLQVVLAKIETGTYVIQDFEGNYLGIPSAPVFPPPDVPAELYRTRRHAQKWFVREDEGGVIISAGRGYLEEYKLVTRGDVVYASFRKEPATWAVTSVGDNKVEIKSPYQDSVFTSEPDSRFQVRVRPAEGAPNQKWNFIAIDRDEYSHRGSRNRFCKQEQW
ncbi:hypothetical protein BGZ81_002507 [Podila clonocystis]|nr:hypothetical protein BGZ81_002507 [Podila clonocystis]